MSPIRDVRFTERIARQCARRGRRLFDKVVCDAIANGSRRVVEPRGPGGGPVILFERPLPAGHGGAARGTVRVLGEVTGTGCVALLLLSPLPPAKKSPKIRDF
jgi:hypothetical protein